MRIQTQFLLELPPWVGPFVEGAGSCLTAEDQVRMAIALSHENVRQGTGGPFGAAVFDATGRVLGVGVNRVVASGASIAHAEILALSLSQQALGRYRLNQQGQRVTLASSSQPCCQCFGACVWAGIDGLLTGARAEDVQRLVGFDEGPLPTDWRGELSRRGIALTEEVLRSEACDVLAAYAGSGIVY